MPYSTERRLCRDARIAKKPLNPADAFLVGLSYTEGPQDAIDGDLDSPAGLLDLLTDTLFSPGAQVLSSLSRARSTARA